MSEHKSNFQVKSLTLLKRLHNPVVHDWAESQMRCFAFNKRSDKIIYVRQWSWREASGFVQWHCKHSASYRTPHWMDDPHEAHCTGSQPASLPSILCCWEAGWGQQQTLDSPAKPDWEGKRMGLIIVTMVTTKKPRMNVAWMQYSMSRKVFKTTVFYLKK